jgi:polysaccharide export outer membrane protein
MAIKFDRIAPTCLMLLCCLAGATSVAMAQPGITDYVIGPEDILTITSFDQEDLSGKYPVDADGTFTFPLVGRVKAGGMTLRELEGHIRTLLKDGQFFRDPQLAVGVEAYRSQKIHVVGEVRNPGTYSLAGNMNLIEAIARSGSTLPSASGEALIVRPKSGGATQGPTLPNLESTDVITVDVKELQSGALSRNIQLKDGDTIFVPRAETVYVFGQVKNPGAYSIQRTTTVLHALSLAGGITERGATGRIKIVRIVNGNTVEIKVRLTDPVRPGDTIMVPERFF